MQLFPTQEKSITNEKNQNKKKRERNAHCSIELDEDNKLQHKEMQKNIVFTIQQIIFHLALVC